MYPSQKEIQELLNLYNTKNFKIAESKTKKYINLYPDNPTLYNILGTILTAQNKIKETHLCYKKILKINPDFVETYNNYGIALKQFGQLKEAIIYFKKALKLKPNFIEARFNLAVTYKVSAKYEEAIKNYKEVLKNKPDVAQAYNNLGIIFNILAKFQDANSNYLKALEINPNLSESHMHLSYITKYTKGHKHIQEMEKAISITNINDTQRMYLSFGLGKAFNDIENYKKAFEYFDKGNSIRKKQLKYSIDTDNLLFRNLKNIFQKNLFNKFKNTGNSDKTPIFVVGMPRSSTTLVEQILSSHSDIHGSGELTYFKDLVKKYFSSNNTIHFSKKIINYNPLKFERIGSNYIQKIKKLSTNNLYIIDKMPLNFLWIGLIRLTLPNAKIIHCIRDPKDTCLSIFKSYFGQSGNGYAYDLIDLGQYYNLYLDLMRHWHSTLPNYIYDLSYEELIKNQKKETQKLLNFCGLGWDESCMKFYTNSRPVTTASSTQVREPIYKKSIDLWKHYKEDLKPLLKILDKN